MSTEQQIQGALADLNQRIEDLAHRMGIVEGVEATYPTQFTIQKIATLEGFMQGAMGVTAQVTRIEERLARMEQNRSEGGKFGLEKMFDGKNVKMIPDTFDKETASKSFRSWESKTKLFIELADKEAGQILKLALNDELTDEQKKTYEFKNKYIHGVLMMLTEGEAHGIVEANPSDGAEAWKKLHL
eukprot:8740739-Karenia_brevis.AAC.1